MVRWRETEYGEIEKETSLLANGKIIRLMDMEYISLVRATIKVNYKFSKDSFRSLLNMGKVCSNSRMEMYTKDFTRMESLMVMGNIIGRTVLYTKEIFLQDFEKEKGFGRMQKVITMKVSSKTIKRMAMEYFCGKMETNMREILSMMQGGAREKWFGTTAAYTKETGKMVILTALVLDG
jgi:hypothetical protein